MMMQELQSFQNRYEGRMEENERTVTQLIVSEAREALRGQRSHMLQKQQVLVQAGEEEGKVREESQMHSKLQSYIVSYQ